ncbi:sugar kinase [Pseudoalteromonas marina]|uniref:sugar kinase n=1 Tax=Pseudoalteromonas marina TaxID=267375 RepID=UPI0023F09A12|nr:sugar kinase [Pseudoalteromonas marina]
MKVAVLGECMIELSQQVGDQFKIGFGGDTLNTAIYLCRCHGKADYFTALGNDPYSQSMLNAWQEEGIGIEHVKIKNNALPGLYIINNDEDGERHFQYWRQNSPARTLLSDYPSVLDEIKSYEMIFLSGITLSLYPQDDLIAFFNCLSQYRKQGGIVVFDNNYRPRNWMGVDTAVQVFSKMMTLTDVALISFDDEKSLYGEHSVEQCINRWVDAGVEEVVVKNGHHGCHLYKDKQHEFYPLKSVLKPVDTTAAGDSFNGAYLAAKLQSKDIKDCISAGQQCASTVIMYKGAIIERNIALTDGGS